MAGKFQQHVEHASSTQSIINYFNNFSCIKPTHIEEAQILLDSNNLHAILALQTLVANGRIKENLDELKIQTDLKQQELNLIKQSIQETWRIKRIQVQHTR